MRFLPLAVSVALWGITAEAQSNYGNVPSQTIEISSDNIDLSGAGTMRFDADLAKMEKFIPPTAGSKISLKLWFNSEGTPVQCDPAVEIKSDFPRALCQQMMNSAHFKLSPGFGLMLKKGFVMVDALYQAPTQFEPDLPIRFVRSSEGVWAFLGVLYPQPNKANNDRCIAQSPNLSMQASNAICSAYLAQEEKTRKVCTNIVSDSSTKMVTMSCWIAVHPTPSSARGEVLPVVVPGYRNVNIRYASDQTPVSERLSSKDGQIILPISQEDYPSMAIRLSLSGRVAVLLGVSADGKVANCRPLTSSGSAFLDNSTCALMVQRGHFRFSSATLPYSGLRYIKSATTWSLP